ncbi:MAG: hypothetical protein J6T47_05235 [Lachnospiraceae bacterium]|nr:hypothetical protein [Lachnospiraceae bacterium]
MSFVFGVILGVVTGLGIALLITSCLIKDSNDIGDSIGRLENFGRLNIIHEKMRLSSKGAEKDAASSMSFKLLTRSYEAARKREGLAENLQKEAANHAGLQAPKDLAGAFGINGSVGMNMAAGVAGSAKTDETAQTKVAAQTNTTEEKDYIDMSEVAELLGRNIGSDQKN